MDNQIQFIPAVACLLAVAVGFVLVIVAVFILRRANAAPPLLTATPGQPQASRKVLNRFLWATVALGAGIMGFGILGAWATKCSVWVVADTGAEWSDGRAPLLEPLIRKHCAPFLKEGKTVGMAVALVTPTNATLMTFGRPTLCSHGATRADTLFELGSITKTFTGLILARQIQAGAVRLEQPIHELLPPGTALPEPARGITLRHLTTHSSGFPRVAPDPSLRRALGMVLWGSDPYGGYDASDLLADVRSVKLESKPGSKSCYSNFGMTLLGFLLANNAHSTYQALVQRTVCAPLGMGDTAVVLDAAQERRAAQGYRALQRWGPLVFALRSAPWFSRGDLAGAGGLKSTPADMLKYLRANMHPEGQALEAALREAQQVLFKEDEHTAYGMNWIHHDSQTLKQKIIWHNGGTGGFCSFVGFTADRRFGVLVLSNSNEGVDDLAIALLREATAPAGGK